MDNNVTRTVYGADVMTSLLLGLPQTYPQYTTLNEYLSVQKDTLPAVDDRPSLGYYVWGNRGHSMIVGTDGIALNEVVQHRATDAGLFGQLPFVLREVNQDLTAIDRAKYVLRRQETRNGVVYYAYYGRRLDKSNLSVGMYYTQVQDGIATVTNFVPTQANLTPTPQQLSNTATNVINADYVSARARMQIAMTEQDVAEMLNVAKVIYDDERYAIVSELGLCTGVDKMINAPAYGGGSFQFAEVIGCQIAAHVAVYNPLLQTNTGVSIEMDVGVNEPLYALSAVDGSITNGLTTP
ncbi:putative virion structural protein [Ralstonia phage RP31]|uniref:Putative virion structural protein n=2 Tax=Ripduovirus RP12 TaxID=2560700 RepID=A0A1L7N0R3_9CAUD|nr:putative virion structural protein [Ralstonia phage RP12]BAW19061.1 putative virion structural protein [Ralstonia phage RP12]BAW19346.1 putative virion structural protein [Ralstonia phage RP31]